LARWALVLTAGVVALAAACSAGDRAPDRGGVTATPTAAEVASAAGFCALPAVPPTLTVGPLRREQGIDGLVVFRASGPGVEGWLAAGGMPSALPSVGAADLAFGPDLPSGTPVVAQHRAQRPGGGIVYRSAVLGPGAVEVRCFET
jgi:hypothetical protein